MRCQKIALGSPAIPAHAESYRPGMGFRLRENDKCERCQKPVAIVPQLLIPVIPDILPDGSGHLIKG